MTASLLRVSEGETRVGYESLYVLYGMVLDWIGLVWFGLDCLLVQIARVLSLARSFAWQLLVRQSALDTPTQLHA